jgi:hypothetical protein
MKKEMAMKTKEAKMPARLRDSIAYSAMNPKSVCTCGHTGDGAGSQHLGFGGHGSCIFDGGACCGQFSWKGWTLEYRQFMAEKGHEVR